MEGRTMNKSAMINNPAVFEAIKKYESDPVIIKLLQSKITRLTRTSAIKLCKHLILNDNTVAIKDLQKGWAGLLQYNKSKFTTKDEHALFETTFFEDIRERLLSHILKTDRDFTFVTDEDIKDEGEVNNYKIINSDSYNKFRDFVIKEACGDSVKYNFDKSEDKCKTSLDNTTLLQKMKINVMSKAEPFDYPTRFFYKCSECQSIDKRYSNEVVSTNGKVKCKGLISYTDSEGRDKSKVCNTMLSPDNEISETMPCFYYQVNLPNGENDFIASEAVSFLDLAPGYYETVLFKINNPNKKSILHIVDIKLIDTDDFVIPKKEKNEHFALTLSKSIDKHIESKINYDIYGMLPIKLATIMQAVASYTEESKNFNIMVVGDPSTGKSLLGEKWGPMLYGQHAKITSADSVSIPALRGTPVKINLNGKETSIVSPGFFGTHRLLALDEIGENKELVRNLKQYLLKANYDYSKAGGDGISKKRMAMVYATQNIDVRHIESYNKSVKEKYNDINYSIKGSPNKPTWDESQKLFKNLFMPLETYDCNKYLQAVIEEHREYLKKCQVWWIDGYEYAVHNRFPLYFYLVKNNTIDTEMKKVIKKNSAFTEIDDVNELMRLLKSNNLIDFFKGLSKYAESTNSNEYLEKLDVIIEDYRISIDARSTKFYYTLLKLSRMINQRKEFTDEDLEFVKYIIEKTERRISLSDCIDYEVKGPAKKIEKQKVLSGGNFGEINLN